MIPIRDELPTHRTPVVTIVVILVCVAAQIWQWSLGEGEELLVMQLGLIQALLTGAEHLDPRMALVPPPITLVTSMFLHGGLLHLGGNLLYLWIFGNNVEDRFGHGRFALFYLVSGLVASATQVLPEPGSPVPIIGASGAISGVLGAYLVLYPRARVHVVVPISLMFLHTVPAIWVLGLWFALQLGGALLTSGAEGGVAWWAHVGGFVAGMALAPLFAIGTAERQPYRRRGPWG